MQIVERLPTHEFQYAFENSSLIVQTKCRVTRRRRSLGVIAVVPIYVLLMVVIWDGEEFSEFLGFGIGAFLLILFVWGVFRFAESLHEWEYVLAPQQIKIGIYDATINERTVQIVPTKAYVHFTFPFWGASVDFESESEIVEIGFYQSFPDRVLLAELATHVYPSMRVTLERQLSVSEREWVEAEKVRILMNKEQGV